MKFAALAVLGLALLGCGQTTPSQPRMVQISGTVTLARSGGPAPIARVTASTRDTTFADAFGRYSLSVPASTDSVSLVAQDGFAPIPYVETCHHETRVLANHSQTVDIVLDQCIIF
jgi:hypothetical protein